MTRQCQPSWMGSASYPPNPFQLTRDQRRSEASHWLPTNVQDHPFQKASLIWSYSTCCSGNGSLSSSPRDWKIWRKRLAHTWTRTVEADLKSSNIGLHCPWHRTQDRNPWSRLVQTAIPQYGSAPDDDDAISVVIRVTSRWQRIILTFGKMVC